MKFIKQHLTILIFLTLFLLSLSVRLYSFSIAPPSLNWDEVSLGYNAYSIIKTGHDEWHEFMPLIFKAYGDYKLPLYIYLTAPFTLLGLTPLTTRIVSLLAGSLLPFFVFKLSQKIFNNNHLSFLAALLVSLSPWSIFLSTIALEANLFLLLFTISLYLLLNKNYSLSALFFGLCLFTYNSSRVLLPFYILISLYLITKNRFKYNFKQIPSYLFFILTVLLFVYQSFFSGSGSARYQWVSLLDEGTINRINENRGASKLPGILPRLAHNKVTYFINYSSQNYFLFLDPKFIFDNGGSQQQFNPPGQPLIQSNLVYFYFIGLAYLSYLIIKYKKSEHVLLFLFWLIAPLPSAITRDAPHVLRAITYYPLVSIIIVLGFNLLINLTKSIPKFFIPLLFVALTLLGTVNYLRLLPIYSQNFSQVWQYGYKEVVAELKNYYPQYGNIWVTKKYGEPHEFINFFWPWDPSDYQTNPSKKTDYHAQWYWVNEFDKFTFINDWEIPNITPDSSTLLVTSPNNYNPNQFTKIKSIYYPNGRTAFDIVVHE